MKYFICSYTVQTYNVGVSGLNRNRLLYRIQTLNHPSCEILKRKAEMQFSAGVIELNQDRLLFGIQTLIHLRNV